jgi:hypothetical protein
VDGVEVEGGEMLVEGVKEEEERELEMAVVGWPLLLLVAVVGRVEGVAGSVLMVRVVLSVRVVGGEVAARLKASNFAWSSMSVSVS